MKVYAYTITRANTAARCRLLLETITIGRETAGMPFHWHVTVNGADILANKVIPPLVATEVINEHVVNAVNEGQHPPTNRAIAAAIAGGFDYLLRVDDDVEWLSKRWLAKLVEAAEKLGQDKILSPMVKGLRWQPPQTNQVEIEQIPVKFVEGPLGGICRLTSIKHLKEKPYISDVRLPMGGGDTSGVGQWAMTVEPVSFLVYCQHIKVRHAKSTDGQVEEDPKHFVNHALYQHVPYIPVWKRDGTDNPN